MKLCLVLHSLGAGGAERVSSTLANYWAAGGWAVTVLTITGADQDRYPLHPSIRRIGLGLEGESSGILHGAWQTWRRVRALRRTLKRERFDAAVAMLTTPNVLLALAGVGLGGMRRVGSERTYPPALPLPPVWELLRASTYRYLDAVVAPTTEIRDWLLSRTSARRVEVVPNPVSFPLPAREPTLSPQSVGLPGRHRLISVGRLGPEKQYLALVEVFARLVPDFPDWELLVVGDGLDRPLLERTIEERRLQDRVFLPGQAGNIGDWYGAADLYVLCSRFEGFPNALAEAMAAGLPAVGFDCNTGPRDIIRDGVDGTLVPADDWGALEGALRALMADPERRRTFGREAMAARERFAVPRVAARWEALIQRP